jgi:hypothetical protein
LARSLASSFSVAATSRFNIAVGMQKGKRRAPGSMSSGAY